MAASVADVAAVEAGLTPALLQQHHGHHISEAPMVLLDGNLSPATLLVRTCIPFCHHTWHAGIKEYKSVRLQLRG